MTLDRAVAFRSEHTASGASGTSASVAHSGRVCESRLIDETRNSTEPPAPATFSASRSDVKVLPVPQAMTSLPRSFVSKPARTASTACTWCGRSFGAVCQDRCPRGGTVPGGSGALLPEPVAHQDWLRIAELVLRYQDLPFGTVDASVVAVAERLGVREVMTLDRRHFSVVRPLHVPAFALLP